jgi:hypothetical protein
MSPAALPCFGHCGWIDADQKPKTLFPRLSAVGRPFLRFSCFWLSSTRRRTNARIQPRANDANDDDRPIFEPICFPVFVRRLAGFPLHKERNWLPNTTSPGSVSKTARQGLPSTRYGQRIRPSGTAIHIYTPKPIQERSCSAHLYGPLGDLNPISSPAGDENQEQK